MGIVPSYNEGDKIWRLHSGYGARVIFERGV